jgi:hypothetical protein
LNSYPHGTWSAYVLDRCRCDTCRIPWNENHKAARWRRAARRTLDPDGRLCAPVPPEKHGRTSTYNGWMCRCRKCTDAATLAKRIRKAERITTGFGEFCHLHGEVTHDHECETT